MNNLHTDYQNFLCEASTSKDPFEQFAKSRLIGATKIVQNAEQKGGDSMLTYHHFAVKLPVYRQVIDGKFKINRATESLDKQIRKLNEGVKNSVKFRQVEFQKIVGLIEVWGELIIKYHETH
jgi:hypothetical protein